MEDIVSRPPRTRSQSSDSLHLPPISAIDNLLTSRSWQPPPPTTSSSSLSALSSSFSKPASAFTLHHHHHHQQQQQQQEQSSQHYSHHRYHDPYPHHHPPPPLGSSSPAAVSHIHSLPPTTSSALIRPSPVHHAIKNIMDNDIDEIVRHCQYLCDTIETQKKAQNDQPDQMRPWLDEMITRANDILNALLRLRKHQMSAELTRPQPPPPPPAPPQQPQLSSPTRQQQQQSRRITTSNRSSSPYYSQVIKLSHDEVTWRTIEGSRVRQRRRTRRTTFPGRCHSCNISETPEWRRGPDGARTLCNACGLHYAKLTRKRAAAAAAAASATTTNTGTSQHAEESVSLSSSSTL
ncbi:hypothetical protein VTP01DRAFT_4615 [Rhizomucor pusillus]|uniref:uncharacterized protein n=1 Tax=Rhizomucor pusillus TaxID=4840 RepID=UPI0037433240